MSVIDDIDNILNSTSNIFEHNNASDRTWNQGIIDDDSIQVNHASNHFNFIFPVIGLLVLVVATLVFQHCRVQPLEQSQSDEYNDPVRIINRYKYIRQKEALRLQMIELALVKTKVIQDQGPSSRRNSSALTEISLASLDCSNSSKDDVVLNIACEEDIEDIEAPSGSKPDSNGCGASADVVLPLMTLEHPINIKGWMLESHCVICLEAYQENDSVSYSKNQNCSHTFHSYCILGWLQDERREQCPCCRSPYLHGFSSENDDDNFEEVAADSTDVRAEEQTNINENTSIDDKLDVRPRD